MAFSGLEVVARVHSPVVAGNDSHLVRLRGTLRSLVNRWYNQSLFGETCEQFIPWEFTNRHRRFGKFIVSKIATPSCCKI